MYKVDFLANVTTPLADYYAWHILYVQKQQKLYFSLYDGGIYEIDPWTSGANATLISDALVSYLTSDGDHLYYNDALKADAFTQLNLVTKVENNSFLGYLPNFKQADGLAFTGTDTGNPSLH